jgi:siroheme synthase
MTDQTKYFPVQIVGTGSGSCDMLTVKAHNAIQAADVVVYDSFQTENMLPLCKEGAQIEKLDKKPGTDEYAVREQVVDVIEKHYRSGKRVVRLKVGDAFIFGRGATEAEIMKKRGISMEIIPGITAAVAASAAFGIAQTEKGESDALIYFMAANFPQNRAMLHALVPAIENGATVVLYMACKHIDHIVAELRQRGVNGNLPVAVASQVGLPNQLGFTCTLLRLPQLVKKQQLDEPVTFFVGKHVRLNSVRQ